MRCTTTLTPFHGRFCARAPGNFKELPVLFVGVRCPVKVALERRRATWGGVGYNPDGTVQDPVRLWHEAVHQPGVYDVEVDTSVLRPDECAELIAIRLTDSPPPRALQRIAELPTA
jgi:chloramphenicol 3-O phosphotransferase